MQVYYLGEQFSESDSFPRQFVQVYKLFISKREHILLSLTLLWDYNFHLTFIEHHTPRTIIKS